MMRLSTSAAKRGQVGAYANPLCASDVEVYDFHLPLNEKGP